MSSARDTSRRVVMGNPEVDLDSSDEEVDSKRTRNHNSIIMDDSCNARNDPRELLSFDPAAVAIRAAMSHGTTKDRTLKQVEQFANKLKHYVTLIQQQPPQPQHDTTNKRERQTTMDHDDDVLDPSQNEQEDNDTRDSRIRTTTTTVAAAVTPTTTIHAAATRPQADDGAGDGLDDDEEQHYADPQPKRPRCSSKGGDGQTTSDYDDDVLDPSQHEQEDTKLPARDTCIGTAAASVGAETTVTPTTAASVGVTRRREDIADEDEQEYVNISKRLRRSETMPQQQQAHEQEDTKPTAREARIQPTDGGTSVNAVTTVTPTTTKRGVATEVIVIDTDDEDHDHVARPKCSRRSAKKVQQQRQQPRHPRILSTGYSGQLKDSKLRRSIGLTRKVLNRHLSDLGLTASFGMPVVSKRNNIVSHLTFAPSWNDLPRTTDETFEYWLGGGPTRLALVSPLDPQRYEQKQQPPPVIPIFWSQPQKGNGGALCHYIGHFTCVRLEKVMDGVDIIFKGEQRQALLEFKFVKFDESLSNTMSHIGGEN